MNNPCFFPTIGSVRQRLAELGIHATSEQVALMRKIHSTERLRIALDRANADPDVRAFLCDALARVGPGTMPSLFPESTQRDDGSAQFGVAINKQVAADPEPVMPSPREARALWRSHGARKTMVCHGDRSHQVPTLTENRARDAFHIYGGTAALTVSPGRNKAAQAVVFIDAAEASQPRQYDWSNKITLMLTPEEMIIALAVVTGSAPSASFKHHGKGKDKSLQIEHQGQNVFFKVGQANLARAIPAGPADAFKFAALLTAQIKSNVPDGARQDVTQLIRSTVVPMLNAPALGRTSRSTQQRPNTKT